MSICYGVIYVSFQVNGINLMHLSFYCAMLIVSNSQCRSTGLQRKVLALALAIWPSSCPWPWPWRFGPCSHLWTEWFPPANIRGPSRLWRLASRDYKFGWLSCQKALLASRLRWVTKDFFFANQPVKAKFARVRCIVNDCGNVLGAIYRAMLCWAW